MTGVSKIAARPMSQSGQSRPNHSVHVPTIVRLLRATSSRLVTRSNSELGDMPPRATATVIPLVQPATVTRLPQRESRPDGVFRKDKGQGKMARSDPRPPFRLPEVTVAVRTSRLYCRKAGKARIITPVRESSGGSRLKFRNVPGSSSGHIWRPDLLHTKFRT